MPDACQSKLTRHETSQGWVLTISACPRQGVGAIHTAQEDQLSRRALPAEICSQQWQEYLHGSTTSASYELTARKAQSNLFRQDSKKVLSMKRGLSIKDMLEFNDAGMSEDSQALRGLVLLPSGRSCFVSSRLAWCVIQGFSRAPVRQAQVQLDSLPAGIATCPLG